MADYGTTDVRSRTVTAFFDSREAAGRAQDDLVALGIPSQHIRLTEGSSTATAGGTSTHDKGFWDELKDMFLPDEDRYSYAEGLKRGGYLLSVRVDDALYDRAVDVLDRDGAVNMDEREASWRASGWSGYEAGSSLGSGATGASTAAALGTAASRQTTAADLSASTATAGSTAAGRTAAAGTATQLEAGRDVVIPIYEETARIAKRDVNQGRVRLRSYVVETPVSEQVNLRSEQVQVERRPVDRAVAAGDAVFQDRVIEAEEHSEQAVIDKQTRVKEEISLRKTVENQSQTISDTVRRTEVEVEDDRAGRSLGTASGTAAAFAGTQGTAGTRGVVEHMDVIASDGTKIGTVDHLDGDRIKLAKSTSPDGQHHYVPLAWIDHVDTHVHLTKSSTDAKAGW